MEKEVQKSLIWISILSGSNDFNDLAMPNMDIWRPIHTSDHIHTYPYPPIRGYGYGWCDICMEFC